ncbi:MAG: DUF4392 domain-containing protein, partial [Gemmataceae bacterium]|nr:DUF4392 domain-containing protein [Gemmataceae bacterium]
MHNSNVNGLLAAIQNLVQVDVGQRGLAHHPTDNLFTATQGDFVAACQSVACNESPCLLIVTGFFIPTATPPACETDGPLGSLFLARACQALGIPWHLASPHCGITALQTGLQQASLPLQPLRTLPVDNNPGTYRDFYAALVPAPSHVVFIEYPGPNAEGRCLTMRGKDITEHTPPAHHLLPMAKSLSRSGQPPASIGIGDGGNEIGMGRIAAATIAANIPFGSRIHCTVITDHLIVAGVSNWGAYALAAGLFLVQGRLPPADLFDPVTEQRLLTAMVEAGPLVDGV